MDTTRIPLVHNVVTNRWEKDPALAAAPFTENGEYEILYFVRDKETLKLAPMKRSLVYRDKVSNTVPSSFNLTRPNGTTENTVLVLEWESSSDSDGLTYTVEIARHTVIQHYRIPATGIGNFRHCPPRYAQRLDQLLLAGHCRRPLRRPYRIHTDLYFQHKQHQCRHHHLTGQQCGGGELLYQPVRALLSITDGQGFERVAVAGVDGSYYLNLGRTGTFTLSASAAGYTGSTLPVTVTSQGRLTTVVQNVTLVAAPVSHTVSVTLAGTGAGTVNSVPASIACPGTCSASFAEDVTSVTLTAFPQSTTSTFAGWAGDYTTSDGASCTVPMNGTKGVIATFTAAPFVMGDTTPYDKIHDAFELMAGAGSIKALAREFIENVVLNRNLSFVLKGGYDAGYTANTGWTAIRGTVTIGSGSLTVERVEIR